MNGAIRKGSSRICHIGWTPEMKPNRPVPVMGQEIETMMIYMLAVAMTIMMLIATAFGMHQEAQRTRVKQKNNTIRDFWPR